MEYFLLADLINHFELASESGEPAIHQVATNAVATTRNDNYETFFPGHSNRIAHRSLPPALTKTSFRRKKTRARRGR